MGIPWWQSTSSHPQNTPPAPLLPFPPMKHPHRHIICPTVAFRGFWPLALLAGKSTAGDSGVATTALPSMILRLVGPGPTVVLKNGSRATTFEKHCARGRAAQVMALGMSHPTFWKLSVPTRFCRQALVQHLSTCTSVHPPVHQVLMKPLQDDKKTRGGIAQRFLVLRTCSDHRIQRSSTAVGPQSENTLKESKTARGSLS